MVERLSSQTLSGKGDIESMVAQLAALGKSADEIESISEAAVYLSNVTGKDLNGSMMNLLDSYTGATGELRKLGIELDGLTKDELAHGAAVDKVIDKLGEYSAMMADRGYRPTPDEHEEHLGRHPPAGGRHHRLQLRSVVG